MNQLDRVVAVLADGKPRTLRGIEHAIWQRFHVGDTTAAISARLREYGRLAGLGWQKQTIVKVVDKIHVWFYQLSRIENKGGKA